MLVARDTLSLRDETDHMNRNVRNELLATYSQAVGELVNRLYDIIHEIVPEASESIKMGWRCVAFRHPEIGYFAGVFPGEDAVRIGLEFGVLLPDPDEILTGEGSQLRYVVAPLSGEAPPASLHVPFRAAVDLPSDIYVPRQMIKALSR